MGLFKEIFIWWDGNTWGTRLTTWRLGRLVGEDESGNRYYEQKRGVGPLGKPRRWVTYRAMSEPTLVPPDWYSWLHYTTDTPPVSETYQKWPWQKPHRANMTGTPAAYRPGGSIISLGTRPKATGDYKPWRPR